MDFLQIERRGVTGGRDKATTTHHVRETVYPIKTAGDVTTEVAAITSPLHMPALPQL